MGNAWLPAAYVSKLFGAQCPKKKDAVLLGTLGKATAEHEDVLADDDLRRCTKSHTSRLRLRLPHLPLGFRAKRELAGIETELLAHALTIAVCVRIPRSRILRLRPPPVWRRRARGNPRAFNGDFNLVPFLSATWTNRPIYPFLSWAIRRRSAKLPRIGRSREQTNSTLP